MYSPKTFLTLYLPLLAEQGMATLIGIIAMLMVGYAGDVALSAIGIVNTINIVVMSAFTALASGATAVISQLLGAEKEKEAGECATQFLVVSIAASVIIGAAMALFARPLLNLLYSSSDQEVLDAAYIYLVAISIAVPFLVVFTSISGIFRAYRKNKTPMMVSIIVNIINAVICGFTIYYMNIGVLGVSIATFVARVVGAVIIVIELRKSNFNIVLSKNIKVKWSTIKPVMHIGLPMGLDSMVFQAGKLVVTIFMSGMGTATMAAYSVATNVCTLMETPGAAMQILVVTLVGRSVGAGREDDAKNEMILTTLVNGLAFTIVAIPLFFFGYHFTSLFSSSEEVRMLAFTLVKISAVCGSLIWSPAFVLPYGLRSAGDIVFTIACTCTTLWAVRIVMSWFLGIHLGIGLVGIWWAMILDWVVRVILFCWRLFSDKWKGRAEIKINS